MKSFLSKPWRAVYADAPDNTGFSDAFNPEHWAQESLLVLENSMIAANLVYRDFSEQLAEYGDTVNAHRPGTFSAKRKTDSDEVTIQAASATTVPVVLNQHLHTSFMIKDGEQTKGFVNLREKYLVPALSSIASAIDQIILTQAYRFMHYNCVGKLGTDPTAATVIAAREVFNTNKVPMQGRNHIICPDTEGALLSITDWVNAHTVGDDGSALREGHLGRKFGFDHFMCQQVPSIAAGNTVSARAVNNTEGYSAGDTSIDYDGGAALPACDGAWCTIAGDMTPQKITAADSGTLTISPGLRYAVDNNAVITIYTAGAVNDSDGYAAGYIKTLVTDGFSVAPKSGQLISFGLDAPTVNAVYGAYGTPTTIALDLSHPLKAALTNDDVIGIGPAGNYNFAFHRNALALVTRPLALPETGLARSAVVNYNDLSIRVVITYNGEKQGHLVTVDLLCGVEVLDTALGCVVLG